VRAARGGDDSGEGGPEVGPDQVGELGEEVREQCAAGIWTGWSDCCECRRGARADFGGARKKKGENRRGRWGLGRFYRASTAQLKGEKGRERESDHGRSSRRRAAPACSTG
jgi:hypothetical protein